MNFDGGLIVKTVGLIGVLFVKSKRNLKLWLSSILMLIVTSEGFCCF